MRRAGARQIRDRAGPLAAASSCAWRSISAPCNAWLALPCRRTARSRAWATRARTSALASPAGVSSSWVAGTAGISMCSSMRSQQRPAEPAPV